MGERVEVMLLGTGSVWRVASGGWRVVVVGVEKTFVAAISLSHCSISIGTLIDVE